MAQSEPRPGDRPRQAFDGLTVEELARLPAPDFAEYTRRTLRQPGLSDADVDSLVSAVASYGEVLTELSSEARDAPGDASTKGGAR